MDEIQSLILQIKENIKNALKEKRVNKKEALEYLNKAEDQLQELTIISNSLINSEEKVTLNLAHNLDSIMNVLTYYEMAKIIIDIK